MNQVFQKFKKTNLLHSLAFGEFFWNIQSVPIPFSVELYVLVNNMLNIINAITRILLS